MPTIMRLVGMGVPSKYLTFPLLSLDSSATVALKRARRASPQQTKNVKTTTSKIFWNPQANPRTAGARPNEIYKQTTKLYLETDQEYCGNKQRQSQYNKVISYQVSKENQALGPRCWYYYTIEQCGHP